MEAITASIATSRLIESIPDPVVVLIEARPVHANEAAREVFVLPPSCQLADVEWIARFTEATQESLAYAAREAKETRRAVRFAEVGVIQGDGSIRHFDGFLAPIVWEGSQALYVQFRDASPQREGRATLAQSNRFLQQAHRLASIGHWELRTDGTIHLCEEIVRILGLDPPGTRQMGVEELIPVVHRQDRAVVRRVVSEALEGRVPPRVTVRIVRPSGEVRFVRIWGDLSGADAAPDCAVFGVVQDVTEIRAAEDALRESDRQLRMLADSMSDLVSLHDIEGRFLYVSPSGERLTGFRASELIGTDAYLIIHPEDRERVSQDAHRLNREGKPSYVVWRRLCKDGSYLWLETSTQVLQDPDSGETRLLCVSRDVSKRTELESALLESQRLYRTLADNISDVVTLVDRSGIVVYASPSIKGMSGFTGEEVVGRPWVEFAHPDDQDALCLHLGGVDAHRSRLIQWRMQIRTGDWRWVESSSRLLSDSAGVGEQVLSETRDIQERQAAEEALRLSEERFRTLFEQSTDGIILSDDQGNYVEANQAAADLFQVRRDELLQLGASGLGEKLGLELAKRYERYLEKGRETGSLVFTDQQGLTRTLEYVALEFSPRLHLSILRDVTERVEAQAAIEELNRSLEERVREQTAEIQAANAALEEFTRTVAHDLRAPLRTMEGFATALLEEFSDRLDDTGRDYAARIKKAVAGMDALVRDLLVFCRLGRPRVDAGPTNAGEVVAEVLRQLDYPIAASKASIEVIEPLPIVLASSNSLSQAMANLILNAIKFVRPGVPAQVKVWSETRGDQARIWVEDQGIGVPIEYREQIFRPFERLHRSEIEGSGIGLAIVKKAVETFGGRAGVESGEPMGSRFWIELPLASPSNIREK